jgi:hypothetical protein
MQHTAYGRGPSNNLGTQSRTIAITALCLFALAGLISGFAVGAFVRPGHTKQENISTTAVTPKIAGQTAVPTRTPSLQRPVNLGIPKIDHVSYSEVADGTTTYTLSSQVITRSDTPVHAPDVTCKVWLVQQIPDGAKFDISNQALKDVNNLQNPIVGTVKNQPVVEVPGLTFTDANSPQTHLCTPKGRGTWTYQVTPSVPAGVYDLIVLNDWSGVHYNWSWVQITIQSSH